MTERELRQCLADGRLTQEQYQRMIEDGPPYYAEQHTESAKPLTEDGQLRTDATFNIRLYRARPDDAILCSTAPKDGETRP